MRVLFLVDVTGVALGGEVKEVKNGFARNYLIPQKLGVPATRDALQRVERLKQQAEATRVKTLDDMKDLSGALNGAQVNVEMRAGASGRLYGSVTTAVIAAELSRMTELEIDRRTILLPEAVREVGRYDVRLRLHSEVDANITLVVYPVGTDPADLVARLDAEEADEAEAAVAAEDETGTATIAEQADVAEVEASIEAEEAGEVEAAVAAEDETGTAAVAEQADVAEVEASIEAEEAGEVEAVVTAEDETGTAAVAEQADVAEVEASIEAEAKKDE